MSAVDPREGFACDRETIGGLRVVYDDGQNVRVEGMAPCPWCGEVRDDPYLRPYVQVSGVHRPSYEARAVCPTCHAATAMEWQDPSYVLGTDLNVTRDRAVERAVARWNDRRM